MWRTRSGGLSFLRSSSPNVLCGVQLRSSRPGSSSFGRSLSQSGSEPGNSPSRRLSGELISVVLPSVLFCDTTIETASEESVRPLVRVRCSLDHVREWPQRQWARLQGCALMRCHSSVHWRRQCVAVRQLVLRLPWQSSSGSPAMLVEQLHLWPQLLIVRSSTPMTLQGMGCIWDWRIHTPADSRMFVNTWNLQFEAMQDEVLPLLSLLPCAVRLFFGAHLRIGGC